MIKTVYSSSECENWQSRITCRISSSTGLPRVFLARMVSFNSAPLEWLHRYRELRHLKVP